MSILLVNFQKNTLIAYNTCFFHWVMCWKLAQSQLYPPLPPVTFLTSIYIYKYNNVKPSCHSSSCLMQANGDYIIMGGIKQWQPSRRLKWCWGQSFKLTMFGGHSMFFRVWFEWLPSIISRGPVAVAIIPGTSVWWNGSFSIGEGCEEGKKECKVGKWSVQVYSIFLYNIKMKYWKNEQ